MAGYQTFCFMIRKKWFWNGKHSDSQIFFKIQRSGLQVVANNTGEIPKIPKGSVRSS